MNLPVEFYLAWQYTRRSLRQSLLISLAVGMGVSIIIFIPSVNLSFFNYFLEKTVENAPHLNVTRELETMANDKVLLNELGKKSLLPANQKLLFSDQTLTRRRNIQAYRNLMHEIKVLPGVSEVAPYVSESIIITHGSQVRGVSVKGIEPALEKNIWRLADEVASGNLDMMGPNDVFLGWRLAEELGVRMGSRIQLVTAHGNRSYKVAGILNSGIYTKDLSTVLISLEAAQELLNMSNEATGISVKLKNLYLAPEISEVISRTFHVKTRNWMEENEVILDQIGMFRVIIAFISVLITLASASSITSVLIMVVASKSKEIGILKAMGTAPGQIMRLFLFQAVAMAILGCIAGILGGLTLISIYNATPFAKAETFLGIGRQPVGLNLEYTMYAIMYAMGSSILASIFPAWRAAKLDPVKAMNQ